MVKPFAVILFALAGLAALWGGITLASQQVGGGTAGLSGPFAAQINVQDDVCEHDEFIWGGPGPHNKQLQVLVDGQNIAITGTPPWVNISGTIDGTGFFAEGHGAVGPNSNATVQMEGTWDGTTLTGKYVMGAGPNELPPCGQPPAHHAAVYGIKPKPVTPTPTGTPEKFYSIIVLKLDEDSNLPLPGWRFNLYFGDTCEGTPLDSDTTDEDGLLHFVTLAPGVYSVEEKPQDGWNNVTPLCQQVEVPGTGTVATAGIPPCPITPDAEFPQPGCDAFGSAARVKYQVNGSDVVHTVNLNGPTLIARTNKPHKNTEGRDEVDTEIVHMELTGTSGLGQMTVVESPSRDSTGKIIEQQNSGSNKMNFPADSYFDVFFEVTVGGLTLHNNDPFRMECKIEEVPPVLCFYLPPITGPIVLYNDNEVKVATLKHALHIPLPPKETLIIFTNRPKTTPTITPTPTPGAPTPVPTNPAPNGNCTKTAQNVTFQDKVWDQWKCVPTPPNMLFNRVDIFVGSAQPDPVLSATHFVCQSTNEKVDGVFKRHKNNANPGTNLPNSDVWSGDFNEKCVEGVDAYVQSVAPAVHATIVQVAFTDNQEATATPTRTPTPPTQPTATATPRLRDGDANKDGTTNAIDAALVLQHSAGLITTINPRSDANDDGTTNAIDAAVILQFVAGLIDALPV